MRAIRRLLAQRHLALLLCIATLLLKLLVPTGYMLGSQHGRVGMELCTGLSKTAGAMAGPGMHGAMPGHGKSYDHGKTEQPCAFSGLTGAALDTAGTIWLTVPIAFVLIVVLGRAARSPVIRPAGLRPPLRGPPARP